ncbi:MAG: DNA repair protein RadA [Patescibacteria group bacterium]|nr:DNA repair protein RadA [Patescibacteria group bacterium]
MTKTSSIFICQKCGAQSPRWAGRCSECGAWSSLVEETKVEQTSVQKGKKVKREAKLFSLGQVSISEKERVKTGVEELDRVLGGGIVAGSVVLFSGQPGIGKSTLLTQIALKLLKNKTVVYVCGEESPQQVKLRISRLGGGGELANFFLFPETDVDLIISKIQTSKFQLPDSVLIIDSIQTLTTTDLSSVAGSVGQVRESTHRLIDLAKTKQIPIFLVGHVTKQGFLAGPKTIEHAVDTVLYFEGERSGDLRLLRSIKNRFGPTDEVGVFSMGDKGLIEVKNPSLISSDQNSTSRIGLAYSVVFEGTRPMVVEIQSLVTKSFAPIPKRVVNGLDRRRAEMLIAITQKHLRLPLWEYDVFINIAGGLKITEPAADLAVCAAIYSSYKNKSLVKGNCLIGEVSLLGSVNLIGNMEKRIKQAKAVGLTKIYSSGNLPKINFVSKIIS